MSDFIGKVKERILHSLPGTAAQLKMAPASRLNQLTAPDNARQSGVMVLLFMEGEEWHTLLMQRTEDGHTHSGQISFPGGKKEDSDRDIIDTAARECEEEIGIDKTTINMIGTISPLYIPPSNFHVTPVLGFLPGNFAMKISEQEVQEVYKIPLSYLFDDKIKEKRSILTSQNLRLESPVYVLSNSKIVWGATAMIISELEHLIEDLL